MSQMWRCDVQLSWRVSPLVAAVDWIPYVRRACCPALGKHRELSFLILQVQSTSLRRPDYPLSRSVPEELCRSYQIRTRKLIESGWLPHSCRSVFPFYQWRSDRAVMGHKQQCALRLLPHTTLEAESRDEIVIQRNRRAIPLQCKRVTMQKEC